MIKFKNLVALGISMLAFNSLMSNDCSSSDPCPPSCDSCDLCEGWSAQVDWIFWKVRKSGLDYAVYNDGITNQYYPDGKIYKLEPDYESGVRVALFKLFDNFDFGVKYTWLGSEETDSIDTSSAGYYLRSTRGLPYLSQNLTFDYAKAEYDFKLNKVDIEAGYIYHICDGIMRTFTGFQYTSIDQDLDTTYLNGIVTNGLDSGYFNDKIREDNNIDAYGLYAGLESQKDLWCNFGLYGRFLMGVSVAEFERNFKYKSTYIPVPNSSDIKESRAHKDEWLLIPNIEFAVGLTYNLQDFYCMDWNLTVGYEFHDWYCLPDFINFTDNVASGHLGRNRSNLGNEGLFVRLNAAF